jgi:hypothetical protein
VERPPTATIDSSFTVSSCPAGQSAGASDSAIGRLSSNWLPQLRHRYSYRGMPAAYGVPPVQRPPRMPSTTAVTMPRTASVSVRNSQ